MDDPAFDAQVKREMGGEMIRSLPPEMLCTVSKSSRIAVELAMKGRLTDIGNTNGRNQSTEATETPKQAGARSSQRKTRS
mgnify:FL=1